MRPPAFERLLSAAQPRGIDLVQVAVEAYHGLPLNARRRRELLAICAGLEVEELRGMRPAASVRGKQTRAMRKHADLRPALSGIKGAPYLAACHSYLLDAGVRTDLHWSLLELAGQLGSADKERRWPVFVPRLNGNKEPWVERLCDLLLTWDWFRDLFARVPSLYWDSLNVSEEIWRATLLSPFTALRLGYEGWLAQASANVTRGIYEAIHMSAELDSMLEAS